MADLPLLTIRRTVRRPEPALVERFRDAPSGFVADAQGRQGALRHDIRPLTANRRFLGPALCVRTRSRDNLACWAALDWVRPGDVLVIADGGTDESAVIGDNFVGMAKNAGAVACVTDGLIRDVAGLDGIGLPVFGRGVSPNSPWKDGPGEVGLTVSVGGVTIRSGDLVVGDADGVVVVPQDALSAVIEELEAVRRREASVETAIRGGLKSPTWLPDALRAKGVRYVD